jgi:hypothetical protein
VRFFIVDPYRAVGNMPSDVAVRGQYDSSRCNRPARSPAPVDKLDDEIDVRRPPQVAQHVDHLRAHRARRARRARASGADAENLNWSHYGKRGFLNCNRSNFFVELETLTPR